MSKTMLQPGRADSMELELDDALETLTELRAAVNEAAIGPDIKLAELHSLQHACMLVAREAASVALAMRPLITRRERNQFIKALAGAARQVLGPRADASEAELEAWAVAAAEAEAAASFRELHEDSQATPRPRKRDTPKTPQS